MKFSHFISWIIIWYNDSHIHSPAPQFSIGINILKIDNFIYMYKWTYDSEIYTFRRIVDVIFMNGMIILQYLENVLGDIFLLLSSMYILNGC